MLCHKLDKKTKKKAKKLSKWIKKLQSYKLFKICKNASYTLGQIMDLPLAAALDNRSLEYMSIEDENRVSADDFYHHANNKITKDSVMKMHLRYCSEICKLLKNMFGKSSFDIAIDFTDDCFYGEIENSYVTGGKRKNSTNYFFRYLTVAIIEKDFRFVIYSYPVSKDDSNDALLVEEAIKTVRKLRIGIKKVLLDREFYNSKICLICDFYEINYIIPMKKDSKAERWIETFRKEGKKFPRIIENYEIDNYPTNLLIMEEENSKGKTEVYGYITNIEVEQFKDEPEFISENYRKRWAIENANKFQDSFNIPTNSNNGIVRHFFFVLTALLHNFWVLVNLFGKMFSLWAVPLNMIKDIAKTILGFSPAPQYKHAQRKLWLGILLG